MVDNKTKLTDLQQQRAELSQRFTPSHPAVAALDAQIAALTSAQNQLGKSVSVLPDTEQTALRLMRDVRVNTELYTNLLNSAQQLRIAKAGQLGNVRVVDFAEAADDPVRPKRLIVILISAGVGLVLGILVAFVRKSLYGGVERPEEIEKQLGVRVFAIVPRSSEQLRLQRKVGLRHEGLHVLAAQAPEDAAVEGIRGLRTSLQLQLADAKNNVVMLTGSRPEAGKSFLSVNLATLVASARKRVLLIDADMRRGDIHSHFGVRHSPGLSDVLMGGDAQEALLRDVLPGVDLLTKGSLPSHPSELLESDRFKEDAGRDGAPLRPRDHRHAAGTRGHRRDRDRQACRDEPAGGSSWQEPGTGDRRNHQAAASRRSEHEGRAADRRSAVQAARWAAPTPAITDTKASPNDHGAEGGAQQTRAAADLQKYEEHTMDNEGRFDHRHHWAGRFVSGRTAARKGLRSAWHQAPQFALQHRPDRPSVSRSARSGPAAVSAPRRPDRLDQPPARSCSASSRTRSTTSRRRATWRCRSRSRNTRPMPTASARCAFSKRSAFSGWRRRPASTRHRLRNCTASCRKCRRRKPRRSIRAARMRSPSSIAYWITVNYREAYGMYACNGILFNHESPVRGETFVTRKITRAIARIAVGLQDDLYLGNLSALRDWGHARDYVEMQWLMLQQEQPEDFVIATGVQYSVREFVQQAAAELGVHVRFEGEGVDEVGIVEKRGRARDQAGAGRRDRACRSALLPPDRSRNAARRSVEGACQARLASDHAVRVTRQGNGALGLSDRPA